MRDSRTRRWFSAPRTLRRAAREQLERQRRRRLLLEPLECRHLLAGDFFVNDNWVVDSDEDGSGSLTADDIVINTGDSVGATVTKTFGVDAFDSIQDAINAADPGDEVVVLQGTYAENVTIADDGLILSGHTGAAGDVVIDGSGVDVITVQADGVEVRHLRVTDGQNGIFVDGGDNFTATNVTSDANGASGLAASGFGDITIAGGQYVGNDARGIELVDFTGTATIDGATASDNAAVGIAAINAAAAGTLALLNVSLSGNAAGGGDVQNVASLDFTTTTAPLANTADEILLTDSELTHTRGGVLQQSITYSDVTQLAIQTLGGQDVVTIVSTAAATSYDVDTGEQNDTVHLGDPTAGSRTLDGILGPVAIHGGDNEATPTSDVGPIQGDSNPLAVGDTLAIHDEDSAGGATYDLSDDTFERSGTELVTYDATETVTLAAAAAGGSTINVASTVAGATTITGGAGIDEINVTISGGSNVTISGGGGADPITIDSTGANGFVVINGDAAADTIVLKNTGADSRVQLNGGAGRDQLDVWATASGSKTEIFAGADNDTVNIGNTAVGQRTVDNIDGIIVVDGGAHEAGITSPLGPIQGETNTLEVGDTLAIHDQDSGTGNIYDLDAGSFERSDTAEVTYLETETVDLAAATDGGNTINVTNTVDGGSTTVTGGDNVDTVTVTTTGADSNVTINAGTGSDPVTVNATGTQSFLVVNGGDEGVATGDALVLKNTGADSRVRLAGGAGRDAIEIWATAAGSESEAFGGSENDTVDVGNPDAGLRTLENVDGIIEVRGETHETGAAAATHAAIVVLGDSSGELFVGDTLNLNDQDSASSSDYSLSDATFSRTGTQVVIYGTTETVNLGAAENHANDIDVASTVAGGTTTIAAGAQLDEVTVAGTGSDSNVTILADEQLDRITIEHTGGDDGDPHNADSDNPLGSFVVIEGGDETAIDGDRIVIENTEPNSRVRIDGDGGQDTIEIWATDFTSEVEVFGGADNDVIHVGNPNPGLRDLEPIDGPIVVHGEDHETLASSPKHAEIEILGDSSGQLFVGDRLNFNDQDSASASTYSLDDASFTRTGAATVSYFTTETVDLNAALSQANAINVATIVSGGTTTINGGSLIDTVVVTATGADSSLLVNSAAGDDAIRLQTTGVDGADGNNADGDNGLGSFVVVSSGSNRDTVELWATGLDSRTQILAGDHNDTIHLGNPEVGQRRVENIDGRIDVNGQAHEVGTAPKHAALTILGDSSGELFVGDTLHVNDQDEAGSQTHSLSASTYGRSGIADNQYGDVETVNLGSASAQSSAINVASTVAGGTTNITAGSAADTIDVTTTGADSNVAINTLAADDEITLVSTGADGADDNNAGGDNDFGSFVVASSGSNRDTIEAWATGLDSRTQILAGDHNDTIHLGKPVVGERRVESIDGRIEVDGQAHEVGAAPTHAAVTILGDSSGELFVGDTLHVNDQDEAGSQTHSLSASTYGRSGIADNQYGDVETVNLGSASAQPSDIDVASTVVGGTTNITAGSAADTIHVTTTGADSNVSISTLSAADAITLASTGADGADGTNAGGDNSLGSFVVVSGGDEPDALGDTIILEANGVASRTHLLGEQGNDVLEMWATSLSSKTFAQGHDDDDTFAVANGNLATIEVAPVVEGGEGSEQERADVRRGGTVNAVAPFFTAATENVGLADKLLLRDAAATGTQNYGINGTLARRGGEEKVAHSQIEQIQLTAGVGNDDVTADFDPTTDETLRVNRVQVDGGMGGDNRLQVQGTSGDDEISLRDVGDQIGAMFEMTSVQRLWVRGGDGLDTIDNQSSVFGLLDGGIGNDRLHSIVSTPSELNTFGQIRNSVLLAGLGQDALMVGATPIETQRVGITSTGNLTGGTFTLTFQGQTTAAIDFNATAAEVQAALVALSNVGPSDVSVTKVQDLATAKVWQIKFAGQYQSVNVGQITIDASAVISAGDTSEVQMTSADTADRGSTYLVGDHAVNPNPPPAMVKTVTPLDRYLSSASVAQQTESCNNPLAAGQHTILAASSTPPDSVQGPFTTITATKIKLSVINWLQACWTLDVTQKGNLAQEARVNNQVAEFLAAPTTSSGGPPPSEPESDDPPTAPLNPFHNPFKSTDVNDDGKVSPSDALAIINQLNAGGAGPLSLPPSAEGEDDGIGELAAANAMWYLFDVNDDGMLSPSDALAVINELNANIAASSEIQAEGEAGDDAETLFALLAEDWHQQQKRRGL